ncbi:MAG: hypothetical protein BWY66_01222 [bacterium ADurb.Bin374]|nr:MAG: hypothetical protein BWY66_01222 [bacterium ADurb.Bin374]
MSGRPLDFAVPVNSMNPVYEGRAPPIVSTTTMRASPVISDRLPEYSAASLFARGSRKGGNSTTQISRTPGVGPAFQALNSALPMTLSGSFASAFTAASISLIPASANSTSLSWSIVRLICTTSPALWVERLMTRISIIRANAQTKKMANPWRFPQSARGLLFDRLSGRSMDDPVVNF